MVQCADQIASSVPSPPTSRARICAIAAVIRARINWIAPGVRNIAVETLQPLFYSSHRTEQTTADSDEFTGDSRFTALRHMPWHIHRIAVTRINHPFIVGELATVKATKLERQ